jgi:hypothetical protein
MRLKGRKGPMKSLGMVVSTRTKRGKVEDYLYVVV